MKLEEALRYLSYGWSIIPVGPDKKPIIKEWEPYQHRQPTVEEMQGWFKTLNPAGIALVTGKQSGVYCIDLDRYKPEFDEEVEHLAVPRQVVIGREAAVVGRGRDHLLGRIRQEARPAGRRVHRRPGHAHRLSQHLQ